MQIQPIPNNYQTQKTQRTQKQNNPSFGAMIKPVDERVFGKIIENLDLLRSNYRRNGVSLRGIKDQLTEIMGCLMEHNNNPASHLRADASCRIPIARAQLHTDQVFWADSANVSAINDFEQVSKLEDKATNIRLTMQNGHFYDFPVFGQVVRKDAETIAKIQDDAISSYQASSGVAEFYNETLQTGGKIENEIL